MEEEGAVSVWFGTADTDEAWSDFITMTPSQDDDDWLSRFAEEFRIEHYDDDLQEAFRAPRNQPLRTLMRGISYESQIVPQIEALDHGVGDDTDNAFILLHDFRFEEDVRSCDHNGVRLRFVGVVQYEHR
jgi:hypothetical protein